MLREACYNRINNIMKYSIVLFIFLYATPSIHAMFCRNKIKPHTMTNVYAKALTHADKLDIERLYSDIKKVGNYDCSQAYVTQKKCLNALCCKDGYRDGIVDTQIRDTFFENLKKLNPVTLIEELRKNTHELRVLNEYAKWKFTHSHNNDWTQYQQIFGLIAHKSMCTLHQLYIIYQDAPADWDERTYHHLGGIKFTESVLKKLIETNQYASKFTKEAMKTLLMETECKHNKDKAERISSKIINRHIKEKESQFNPYNKE